MEASTWSAQQLAQYLAAVSAHDEESRAVRNAVELAAEAFEAEAAAVVVVGAVLASIGFPTGSAPVDALVDAGRHGVALEVPGAGPCHTMRVPLALPEGDAAMVLARSVEPLSGEESSLLRAMGTVLSLTVGNLRTMASLRERQVLLERLSRIQRSISLRAPLAELVDAIDDGAAELLGDPIVTVYLIDPEAPETLEAVSIKGGPPSVTLEASRLPIGFGVPGRVVAEDRLVVVESYGGHPDADARALRVGVAATMAAPVHDGAQVIGCLTVASRMPGRTYSRAEQELLLAFAEHASLAVTDARTVAALHTAVGDATHRAMHDPLTGLANRTRFLDRLGHALAQRRLPGLTVAVLYVDVDDFKLVNDRFGHAVGDLLLVETAARLNGAVRGGDTVARLGGDEFDVLIENAGGAAEASAAAQRILEALRVPFHVGDVEVATGASVGMALLESQPCTADELLRNADVAMYRAKNSGKNRTVVFESAMYQAILDRLELETDLRRIVQADEIQAHYQPIVRLGDQRVLGVEALARWLHPERGFIAPDTFIGLAEDTGLILELGRQVLARACTWAGTWHSQHPGSELFVSVNLSAHQLQDPGLPAAVARVLLDAGLHPRSLMLEITESVLMRDTDVAVARVRALKDLGVHVALDDFGTGYSSLSYLRRFPVDVLKIDRSFVHALLAGREPMRLVEAIVAMGDALGLECAAEGIEHEDELRLVRDIGCDLAQGIYFAGPMPPHALGRYLSSRLPGLVVGLPA